MGLDSETKRWYEMGDVLAHQKIGHAIRDTIRLLKEKTKTTKGNTTKQSKLAKQKVRSSALKLKTHVVPSSDTRQKTMKDILRMSMETSDFLNGIWGDSEIVPQQQTSQMFEVITRVQFLRTTATRKDPDLDSPSRTNTPRRASTFPLTAFSATCRALMFVDQCESRASKRSTPFAN